MDDAPRSETPTDAEILDAFATFRKYTDVDDVKAMVQKMADEIDAGILAKYSPPCQALSLPAVDDDAGWREVGALLRVDLAPPGAVDRTIAQMAELGLAFLNSADVKPMTATEFMKQAYE